MILRTCDVEEFMQRAKGREVVCWGAGFWLSFLSNEYSYGIESVFSYVVDNNPELWGKYCTVVETPLIIRSPQHLYDTINENTLLLITSASILEIYSALNTCLGKEHKIECYFALFINKFEYHKQNNPIFFAPKNFKMNPKPVIPKIIHYTWFSGEPLPPETVNCIESWKKHCPDYETIEWNARNYDLTKHPYVRQAIEEKKWGFAGDYVRLDVLYNYGGIYLDIDVELLRNLGDLLYNDAYFGFQSIELINLGSNFGCIKGHPTIRLLRDAYDDVSFYNGDGSLNLTPSPYIQTESMEKLGLKLNGEFQIVDDVAVYPAVYFSPKCPFAETLNIIPETYSIHHYSGSWLPESELEIKKFYDDVIKNEARIQGGKHRD